MHYQQSLNEGILKADEDGANFNNVFFAFTIDWLQDLLTVFGGVKPDSASSAEHNRSATIGERVFAFIDFLLTVGTMLAIYTVIVLLVAYLQGGTDAVQSGIENIKSFPIDTINRLKNSVQGLIK